MANQQIIFAKRVEQMLLRHTEFLPRVSIPAAKQFYQEFEAFLRRMLDIKPDDVGHLNRKIHSDFPYGKMVTAKAPNTEEG